MKKRTAFLLALLLFLQSGLLCVQANTTGDVDGDGSVSAADARLALRASVKLESLAGGAADAADVDVDDSLTAADARTILRVSVKLEAFRGGLTVTVLDVGQADSILVESGGRSMLVDGGNVADAGVVCAYLRRCGISTLDYLVCTHAHEDHVGGLTGVMNSFSVGSVLAPATTSASACYTDFRNACTQWGNPVQIPVTASTFSLGESTVQVLGPVTESVEDINDTSIVLKITYKNTSCLLTGDAEAAAEAAMLQNGLSLDADVLKVGHHGSASSSTTAFLQAVSPEAAIVSVGAGNSYGHPAAVTLARIAAEGIPLYRTDENGTVRVTCNGKTVFVATEAGTVTDPGETPQPPETPLLYIGNVNTKKFHLPTCSSLPAEANRVYFSARADAVSGGYVACSRCKP